MVTMATVKHHTSTIITDQIAVTRDPLSLRDLLHGYGSTAVPIGSHSKEIDLKRRDISSPWYVSCRSSDFTNSKAYITPEREPILVGACVGHDPQNKRLALLQIPTSWYPKRIANPMQNIADPTRAGGIWFVLGTRGLG